MWPWQRPRVSGLCSCSALSSLLSRGAVRGCRDTPSPWGHSHAPASWLLPDLITCLTLGAWSSTYGIVHAASSCRRHVQGSPPAAPRPPAELEMGPLGMSNHPESLRVHWYQIHPACSTARRPANPRGAPGGPTPRVWDCRLIRDLYSPSTEPPRKQSWRSPRLPRGSTRMRKLPGLRAMGTTVQTCCPKTLPGRRGGMDGGRQPCAGVEFPPRRGQAV